MSLEACATLQCQLELIPKSMPKGTKDVPCPLLVTIIQQFLPISEIQTQNVLPGLFEGSSEKMIQNVAVLGAAGETGAGEPQAFKGIFKKIYCNF